MDEKQVGLVRRSFAMAMPIRDSVSRGFYDRLFARTPCLRRMFADDMTAQHAKLILTLTALVAYLNRPDRLVAAARALGMRHVGYGVTAAHYAPVGEALIATLADHLGPQFTPAVEAAWRAVYATLAATMLAGAQEGSVSRAA